MTSLMQINHTVVAPGVEAPSTYSLVILRALNLKPEGSVYTGSVPAHVISRRRARNKVARLSRKANR